MAINAEMRRMNYTGMSPDHRAATRKVIADGLAALDAEARPELAEELRQTLAIFDEVDGTQS